jgi:Fe-S-cluster containining protein
LHVGTPPGYEDFTGTGLESELFKNCWNSYTLADIARWKRAPKKARQLVEEAAKLWAEGPCVWLHPATHVCRWYRFRPNACRHAVVPGDEACLDFREGRR